jgi:hypothetical protein
MSLRSWQKLIRANVQSISWYLREWKMCFLIQKTHSPSCSCQSFTQKFSGPFLCVILCLNTLLVLDSISSLTVMCQTREKCALIAIARTASFVSQAGHRVEPCWTTLKWQVLGLVRTLRRSTNCGWRGHLLFPTIPVVPAVPGSQRGDAMLRYLSLDAEASARMVLICSV